MTKDKTLEFKVGDVIDIVVTRLLTGGEIRVSRKGNKKSSADLDSLEDAFDMELPVEGRVIEVVKGGFRVQIGGIKAFCPLGQIDLRFTTTPEVHLNQKYNFQITQYENKKKGDKVSVQIDELRADERKISLGLPGELHDDSWKSHASDSKFGTLGDLLKDFKKK